jgi:hypothetical protein
LSVAPKWRAVWHEYDKNERQRGSDAGDSPLLGELEGAAVEGDVVIGGEEGNQGQNHSTERLGDPEAIQARPWTYGYPRFWRGLRSWRRGGRRWGIGHNRWASTNCL